MAGDEDHDRGDSGPGGVGRWVVCGDPEHETAQEPAESQRYAQPEHDPDQRRQGTLPDIHAAEASGPSSYPYAETGVNVDH